MLTLLDRKLFLAVFVTVPGVVDGLQFVMFASSSIVVT